MRRDLSARPLRLLEIFPAKPNSTLSLEKKRARAVSTSVIGGIAMPFPVWSGLISMRCCPVDRGGTCFALLRTSLPALGWEVLMSVYRGPAWTCLVARRDARIGEDDDFLQIDLHAEFTVSGLPFADTATLMRWSLASDGVRWLDDIDAAVCAYLQPAIADGQVKARYGEAFERAQASAPARVDALCGAAIGIASATTLGRLLARGERSSLRRGLLRAALTRRPFRTAAVILHKLVDMVAMYWRPPGRLWTFSGPDGAGKTTVLDLLQPLAQRRVVVAVDRLHTRPYIIPRLAGLLPPSRRVEALTVRQYEKRLGVLKSVIRLTILIVDLQLGYWLKVRPMLARGHLVVFDRYYQDYFVDSRLRGISLPSSILQQCARLVPHGHRHVYLIASAEVLETRKKELSHDEATRTDRGLSAPRIKGPPSRHHRHRPQVGRGHRQGGCGTSAR